MLLNGESDANIDGIDVVIPDELYDEEVCRRDYELFHHKPYRKLDHTLKCECGADQFLVNFLPAPYTGCYLRITCPQCKRSKVFLDDYA